MTLGTIVTGLILIQEEHEARDTRSLREAGESRQKRETRGSLFGFSSRLRVARAVATNERTSGRYHAEREAVGLAVRWCSVQSFDVEGGHACESAGSREFCACTVRQVIRVRGHESIREP